MAEQISNKIVVTRKKHQCFSCLQIFPPKTEMNRSVNVSEDVIYSVYMCKTCYEIVQYFDQDDYRDGFDEGCVLEAAQNDNRFVPSVDNLCTKELIEEYLEYLKCNK